MIKLVKHTRRERTSLTALNERLVYFTDNEEDSHEGKQLKAIVYRGFATKTDSGFIEAVQSRFGSYRESRKGKVGKCTRLLWEEVVYSGIEGAFLSDLERASIEERLIENLFYDVPSAACWHVDPATGRSDLHIAVGRCTNDLSPKIFLSHRFGAGKASFHFVSNLVERSINSEINAKRPNKKQLITTREVGSKKRAAIPKSNQPDLLSQIVTSLLDAGWSGSIETLVNTLKSLQYSINRASQEYISVKSPLAGESGRYKRLRVAAIVAGYKRAELDRNEVASKQHCKQNALTAIKGSDEPSVDLG